MSLWVTDSSSEEDEETEEVVQVLPPPKKVAPPKKAQKKQVAPVTSYESPNKKCKLPFINFECVWPTKTTKMNVKKSSKLAQTARLAIPES